MSRKKRCSFNINDCAPACRDAILASLPARSQATGLSHFGQWPHSALPLREGQNFAEILGRGTVAHCKRDSFAEHNISGRLQNHFQSRINHWHPLHDLLSPRGEQKFAGHANFVRGLARRKRTPHPLKADALSRPLPKGRGRAGNRQASYSSHAGYGLHTIDSWAPYAHCKSDPFAEHPLATTQRSHVNRKRLRCVNPAARKGRAEKHILSAKRRANVTSLRDERFSCVERRILKMAGYDL
jgi:hypothetical protein